MIEAAESPSSGVRFPGLDSLSESFAMLVDAHPDAAYLLDLDGRFLAVNAALCQRVQSTPEQLLGRTFDATVAPIDSRFVRQQFDRATHGESVQYEATGSRPDGTTFLAQITNTPVKVDGRTAAVMGIAVDVTEREGAGERARASGDLLRLAGRMARFGGWSVDASTRQIRLTDDTLRMLGLSPDAPLTNEIAWALHPSGDRERIAALLERCLELGEPFDIESTMVTADGTPLTVRTIGEVERDRDGTVLRAHGAVWDITEYALERSRARDLEERLSTSLRTISDGLIFLDTDWQITFMNPTAEHLLGRSADDLIGRDAWAAYPDVVGTPFEDAFRQAARSRDKVIHREWVELTERWVDITIYPVETGIVAHLRDTTAEVTAHDRESEITRRLEEQAVLLDIARDAIIVRDLDHRVQYWNRSAAELYEIPAADAIGRSVTDVIYDDLDEFHAAADELLREGYWAGELMQRSASGRSIVADCRWQLVHDEHGEPQAVLCVNSDITDYRKEQESRARSQRMESLGTLAGGIAHDLNNVLTPILMSTQLLAQNERDSDRLELLATLETSVKRGAEMVRQVLAFARGVEGRRDIVMVDALIDDLIAYARDAMPTTISIVVDRADSLPSTTGDVTQFMQVLVNLVLNARDAMASGGRLLIAAGHEHFDDEVVSAGHAAAPGDYVVVSIEDNGHGMPSDVVQKVFEPFFTTKETGRGTGLGLSTTLAIVRSHGGFIQVYSEPELGTRFRVGLPVSTTSAVALPERTDSSQLPAGQGEMILVVDDEASIRRITCQTLEAHGYRTLSAADGQEAIAIVESGEARIDLVLTDMMMPVMDGAATTAYLEEHHPEIPIIAASGLTSHGDPSGAVGMGVSRFLAKPFTTSMLLTTVRETLLEHASTKAAKE